MAETAKIKIYRGSQVILETSINGGAKGVFLLKKEDYIVIPFSLEVPVYFKLGDYVDLTGIFDGAAGALLAKRYEITENQSPIYNESTGGYDYQLKFDAYYWKWKNKIFKFVPEQEASETTWSLTDTLDVHMGVFLRNLKELGYKYNGLDFQVSVDNTVDSKSIAITYDNISLLDALFTMSGENAWNCDVWVSDNVIHFGRNEFGDSVKIERDVEAGNITRKDSKGVYGTRFFAFGSTRNISPNYRPTDEQLVVNGVVQKRLMLPSDTPYIDAYEGMTDDEAVEKVVVFDDVYPRRVGEFSDVHTRTEEVTNDDGTKETFIYYRYKDVGFVFKEEYRIEGKDLKIKFESGKLNGMEFKVIFNPDPKDSTRGEQLWEIEINEDYGRSLPDDILRPENGDKYVLSGLNIKLVSDKYVSSAEQELKERTESYAKKAVKDDGTFLVPLRSSWVYGDLKTRFYEFGQRVKLVDPAFFDDGRESRVLGWELKLDFPWDSPIYTVGESMPYSRIGEIEDKVDALTYKGQTFAGFGGTGMYLIRTNDNTTPTDSNVFSARRSQAEHLSKKNNDRAKGKITFERGIGIGQEEKVGIDSNGNAELLSLVVREFLRSPKFVDGIIGEGWKLWMEDGLSKMELDELTVRRVMTVFELIIDRVRSSGGQIVVSAANGKIKTVEDAGDDYRITFEQGNSYVPHDLMRCATFRSGNELHGYWAEIADAEPGLDEGTGYVIVPKSEFVGGNVPEVGDETVLMGNTTDSMRQNLISITATMDGQPRIDILDGVDGKDFVGCLRARLGNLDGIQDPWFPIDNQPHGNGLYADNAYLRGTFLLTTGEDIKTRFEIVEGKIQTYIEGLRKDFMQGRGILSNPTFHNGLSHWTTVNEAVFFTFGQRWIWANGNVLSQKGDGASVVVDGDRPVVLIKNKSIVQKMSEYRSIPVIGTNSDGLKEPVAVHLSFFYKVRKAGRLTVRFVNSDSSGFVDYTPFGYEGDMEATGGYEQFTMSGLWNGTGDFSLSFTGEICVYMLVLTEDEIESLAYKYRTLFEQTENLVRISAAVFDRDGNALRETGLVVRPEGSGLYAFDKDGVLALVGTYTEDGKGIVMLKGDRIRLEGEVTANGKFKVHEDGSIEATDALFSGIVKSSQMWTSTADITVGDNGFLVQPENFPANDFRVSADTSNGEPGTIWLPAPAHYVGLELGFIQIHMTRALHVPVRIMVDAAGSSDNAIVYSSYIDAYDDTVKTGSAARTSTYVTLPINMYVKFKAFEHNGFCNWFLISGSVYAPEEQDMAGNG